jgi:membrane protein YqaA with SNARE-associated domain
LKKGIRLKALNRHYKITKFYAFLKNTAIKGSLIILIIIGLLFFLEYFFIDINAILNSIVEAHSPVLVFTIFFASETILGIVPPDIFIAWGSKTATPWLTLFILATLSYLGGVMAYIIGGLLFRISVIRNYIEKKTAKHISSLRKWGGLFILIGALLPLPHATVSLACGLVKYSFKNYLLWALFRYLRFVLYALVIFKIF